MNRELEERDQEERREILLHYIKMMMAIALIVAIACFVYLSFVFGRMVFSDAPYTKGASEIVTYELVVTKGEGTISVGADLHEHGVIENALVFAVQTKVYQCKIDPGVYEVSSRQSCKEIVKALGKQYKLNHQDDKK